jgi:putative hydrolase of the HAD superfamily
MIRTIIFDVGGVCLTDNPMAFLGKLEKKAGMTKERLYSFTWDTEEWKVFYNKGLLTENQLFEALIKRGELKEDVLLYIKENGRREILKPVPEVLGFIESLRGRYKVYALSNVDRESADYVKKNFRIYNVFDGAVLSYEVGMIKPDTGIYRHALKKFGLKPDECVFVDNRPRNVKGAGKVGIKSIIFESLGQLKRDLARMGLKV